MRLRQRVGFSASTPCFRGSARRCNRVLSLGHQQPISRCRTWPFSPAPCLAHRTNIASDIGAFSVSIRVSWKGWVDRNSSSCPLSVWAIFCPKSMLSPMLFCERLLSSSPLLSHVRCAPRRTPGIPSLPIDSTTTPHSVVGVSAEGWLCRYGDHLIRCLELQRPRTAHASQNDTTKRAGGGRQCLSGRGGVPWHVDHLQIASRWRIVLGRRSCCILFQPHV